MPSSSANRGMSREAVGEETRKRVLAAASRLFARKGYASTSLSIIAEEAGISKSGLLHHFPTKEDLLDEVLQRRDEYFFSQLERDDEMRLTGLSEAWLDLTRHNRQHLEEVALYTALMVGVLSVDHPAHDWIESHLVRTIETLALSFEQGKRDGKVRENAPSWSIARLMTAASDGLQVQLLCAQGSQTLPVPDTVADTRVLLDGILAP